MGGLSPIHLLVLAIVAILLLGGGRFSNLMGDVAKGVKNFKKGMADEDEPRAKPAPRIEAQSAARPAYDQDIDRVPLDGRGPEPTRDDR